MITQSQIFRQIESFLANKTSLGDFEDWLVRSSWNMHLDSRNDAQKLVWKVELNLAEYSSGHLDESELRAELKGLVPHLHDQTDWYATIEEANSVTTQSSVTYLDCSLFQPILILDYADRPSAEASA